MPLTAVQARNAKQGRHSDGRGLYLLVKPSGAKSWVLRVQHSGIRRDFGIGSFVEASVSKDYDRFPLAIRRSLTLEEARKKAALGREIAKSGINPATVWRLDEPQQVHTFKVVAEEYHRQAKKAWRNGKHGAQWLTTLERYAFPEIGSTPIGEVDAPSIQKVLLPIWLTKAETAQRVKQRIGVVLDYAHGKGWRSAEAPMRAVNQLMRGIKQPKGGNFAAMPYAQLPEFMAKLREADFSVGNRALQFLILTAARSGEVRKLQRKDIDLTSAEWRVPAEKMKAGKVHIVPLVPAAVAIIEELDELFAPKDEDLVFPGLKGLMSDATMAKVLRVNEGGGYTVHGFRSTFRDWAADNNFSDSWAEAALAHSNPNKTEAAYRRTTFFEQRRDKLMPAWASFVLADNSNVISLAEKQA